MERNVLASDEAGSLFVVDDGNNGRQVIEDEVNQMPCRNERECPHAAPASTAVADEEK